MTRVRTALIAPLLAVALIAFGSPAVAAQNGDASATCSELIGVVTTAHVNAGSVEQIEQACAANQAATSTTAVPAGLLERVICSVLKLFPGVYAGGAVVIFDDGDIWVWDPLGLGLNPLYDCPPQSTG